MTKATRESETNRSDAAWLARVRDELDPGVRTPARRAAFADALERRIEARAPRAWRGVAATATAVAAALLLWLGLPQGAFTGDDAAGPVPNLLVYAYYETDYLAEDATEDDAFMTDEYLAIASAFDLP